MPDVPALLLTPEESANQLRIGRTKMFNLLATGAIQSVKVGRCRRVPVASLNEYVARLQAEAVA